MCFSAPWLRSVRVNPLCPSKAVSQNCKGQQDLTYLGPRWHLLNIFFFIRTHKNNHWLTSNHSWTSCISLFTRKQKQPILNSWPPLLFLKKSSLLNNPDILLHKTSFLSYDIKRGLKLITKKYKVTVTEWCDREPCFDGAFSRYTTLTIFS